LAYEILLPYRFLYKKERDPSGFRGSMPIYSGNKTVESGCSDEPFRGPFPKPLDLVQEIRVGATPQHLGGTHSEPGRGRKE
jgi:hypothetical protein